MTFGHWPTGIEMGDRRDQNRQKRRVRRLKMAPGHIRANDHLKPRRHRDKKNDYHRPETKETNHED